MTIINTSAYRVGQKFIFYFEATKVNNTGEIIGKGDKKLKLRLPDGFEDWFATKDLTVVKSLQTNRAPHKNRKVVTNTKEQPHGLITLDIPSEKLSKTIIVKLDKKVGSKITLTEAITSQISLPKIETANVKVMPETPTEKLAPKSDIILLEKVSDIEYSFKRFKMDVRMALKRHGVYTEPTWGLCQIIDALRDSLPVKKTR